MKKPYILYLLTGIFTALIIKFFILDLMIVNGNSMEPAIKNSRPIIINKLNYGLVIPFGSTTLFQWKKASVNDVVIYLYEDKYVVKRCIATEGMALGYNACGNETYEIIINQKSYPLTRSQFYRLKDYDSVPEGTVFTIGDNYTDSLDSRVYGFVPQKNILGKVLMSSE